MSSALDFSTYYLDKHLYGVFDKEPPYYNYQVRDGYDKVLDSMVSAACATWNVMLLENFMEAYGEKSGMKYIGFSAYR